MSTARRLPDRLPPRESDNVLFQLFRTHQAIRPLMARVVEGTGVSPDEYGVLGVIVFAGPIAPTDVARMLGMAPTTISDYASRFLARGLARRLPNPADGRSYLLEATPLGVEVAHTIAPRIRGVLDRLEEAAERPLTELMTALVHIEEAARAAAVLDEN